MVRNSLKKNNYAAGVSLEFLGMIVIVTVMLVMSTTVIQNMNEQYTDDKIDVSYASIESLISRPGLSASLNSHWEKEVNTPENIRSIGLSKNNIIATGNIEFTGSGSDAQASITFDLNIFGLFNPFSDEKICHTSIIQPPCFLGGTQVAMAEGGYKNIEDIEIGDMVNSYDEHLGRYIGCEVTHVFHHSADEMTPFYIILNNFLKVTPNHMIQTRNGWKSAESLNIGEILGSGVEIISLERVYEQVPTYDLEVNHSHTYVVKTSKDMQNIVVHNSEYEIAGTVESQTFDLIDNENDWEYLDKELDIVELNAYVYEPGDNTDKPPMGGHITTETYCIGPSIGDEPADLFNLDYNYDLEFIDDPSDPNKCKFCIYERHSANYAELDRGKILALQTLANNPNIDINDYVLDSLGLEEVIAGIHITIVDHSTNTEILDVGPTFDGTSYSSPIVIFEQTTNLGTKETSGTITISIL